MPVSIEIKPSNSTQDRYVSHTSNATPLLQQHSFLTSALEFENDYEHQQYTSFSDSIHAREFESEFCRDFRCCGLQLIDLHDLLRHYEECHVRFEDDDDDIEQGENESDYFDEESWSDSDSSPSSPSSNSPSGSAYGKLDGLAASELTAAVAHLYPGLPSHYPQPLGPRIENTPQYPVVHSTHPLYRHPVNNGNSVSNDVKFSFHNSNIQDIDSFVANFSSSAKRKSVTLADIYSEDIGDCSATSSSSISGAGISKMDSLNPIVKRASIDHIQQSTPSALFSETQISGSSFERKLDGQSGYPIGNNGKPTGVAHSDISRHPYPSVLGPNGPIGPLTKHAGHTYFTPPVNIVQHKEEVYSLIEDLSKSGNGNSADKPYRCTVLGCDKAYKNPNGLKYHNLHGHCSASGMCDSDSPESRPYVCTFLECGKRYKNLNGLKYHIEHSHPNLTAALRAHQSGLVDTNLFGPYPNQAAMTVAAALQAVNSNPMMMAAANAILTAQAINAASTGVIEGGPTLKSGKNSGPTTAACMMNQQNYPIQGSNPRHPLDLAQGQRMESFFPPGLVHKQISIVDLGSCPIK